MSIMPNKDNNRSLVTETKVTSATTPTTVAKTATAPATVVKIATTTNKAIAPKVAGKEMTMSPSAAAGYAEEERTELLGSLTTELQQRTSARVIKKLRLELPLDKRQGKRPDGLTDEAPECETPSQPEDKEPLKFPTVKQRMPKALWSTDEKSLFFEALNEYGKDFDAITSYICAKMKKKGMLDANLKTKTQVSHFYYRTWHKLSKHVHFDENVKKVVQELYALINYGELRKKLSSVNEKTCARLAELVLSGSLVLRARGRNLRVRTPMCRALRRLNQITERACGARVCSRAHVALRARDAGAWARVQALAHNPRAAVALPLRARLHALLQALQRRWRPPINYKQNRALETAEAKCPDEVQNKEIEENCHEAPRAAAEDKDDDKEAVEDHLNMEPDRMIMQEQKLGKKLALHVGPRPDAEVHLPVVTPSEQLSSQKICFSSYLERMGSQRWDKESAKIRTPKRQRKDSTTEKENELKKPKLDDEPKLMDIEESAIDGIELMASYKHHLEDEEKPSTEDEKELKSEETPEEEAENVENKEMSEKEKDSFSEMEDDEKFNKSDTDNESDHGKNEKGKEKFKNLKVKFRIRPKKRGGSIYTLVLEKEIEDQRTEKTDKMEKIEKIEKTEEPTKVDEEPKKVDEDPKPDIDVELALKQIRKGWSVHDAGELTIGDLYLMFGSRSKLELDYWWAEPTPPMVEPVKPYKSETEKEKKEHKTDKGTDSSVEEEKGTKESDENIFSPKNTFNQDSNDGLSGDERKCEQVASPEHKASSGTSTSVKLASKLINRPQPAPPAATGFPHLSDRLRRLLALVGNAHVAGDAIARCACGHVCAHQRRQQKPQGFLQSKVEPISPTVFRHPSPIAPKPAAVVPRALNLEELPRWSRRGTSRLASKRVVVQRLLPLLPKLPAPATVAPGRSAELAPAAAPKLLPKPPPHVKAAEVPYFYVVSESNGQFYFHDGERRFPIALPTNDSDEEVQGEDKLDSKEDVKSVLPVLTQSAVDSQRTADSGTTTLKIETSDIGNLLGAESLSASLSPSRLLRDAEGCWPEGAAHDFSLSSFLSHLEGRHHHAVDSQLQSLLAESSVDYVAKFADLAAEVTAESSPLPAEEP